MKQTHQKRPPRATANSPPVLLDIWENYFINLVNVILLVFILLYTNKIAVIAPCKRNRIETKSVF